MRMKLAERVYKWKLSRMQRAADEMLDGEDFDSRKAMGLVDSYHRLTGEIYDDSRLTEDDKAAWGTAFSQCYDSSFNGLTLKVLATSRAS